MRTVGEYRVYAEECKKLVEKVPRPEDKQSLEAMARAWERLANEREAMLLKEVQLSTGLDSVPN